MMSKQEWCEQFNALNGRYPTAEELQMGLDQGLYQPDVADFPAQEAAVAQDTANQERAENANQGLEQESLVSQQGSRSAQEPVQEPTPTQEPAALQAQAQVAPAAQATPQAQAVPQSMTAQAWLQEFATLNGRQATQEEYQLAYSQGQFQVPKTKKPFNAKLFYQIFSGIAIGIIAMVALYQGFSYDPDGLSSRSSYLSIYLFFLQLAVLAIFWNALKLYRQTGLSQSYDEVTTDYLNKTKQHWLTVTGLILGLCYLFTHMIDAYLSTTIESGVYRSKFYHFYETLFVGQEPLTLAFAIFVLVMMAILSPRWEQARLAKAQVPKVEKMAFLKRIDLKWSLGIVGAVVVLFILFANIYNAATLSGQWEVTTNDLPEMVENDRYLVISGKKISGYVVDDDYKEDDEYDYSSYGSYTFIYGEMNRSTHRITPKEDDDDDRKITYTKVGGRLKIKVGNQISATYTKKRDLFHLF